MAGRERDIAKVLLIGFATLGLGFAWYYFQAFREVDRSRGKRHSPTCFLAFVPFVGPLFGLWYLHVELRSLQAGRREVGLDAGQGFGIHVGTLFLGAVAAQIVAIPTLLYLYPRIGIDAWVVHGAITIWLAPMAAIPGLATSINGYWKARSGTPKPDNTALQPTPSP